MNIEEMLISNSKEIDRLIEKYIPKQISRTWLKNFNPSYEPDGIALQHAINEPVWEFLNRGGKRFRPFLYLTLLEALGGDVKKYRDWAALIELTHEGSIIVDDIEDNGLLRRGKPCLHRIFGIDIAVNAGNFMFFLPLLIFKKQRLEPELASKAWQIWAEEMTTIHFGQALDIWWHKKKTIPSEKQYMQMCAWKTGTLLRMAARLAGLFAGKDEVVQARLGRFAEMVGIAFQIQDDILDIVADRQRFGKAWGNDITEGKKTLMVIHTFKRADKSDREELLAILNSHTRNPVKIKRAIEIIKKYDSIQYAQKRAEEMANKAWKDIESILQEGKAKQRLKEFVEFLIKRRW